MHGRQIANLLTAIADDCTTLLTVVKELVRDRIK
jgi:hypothetical protein